MQNKILTTEQGRSMVEMLGVLAVVGLLSVIAFAAFRIALNKAKANSIIHDARKAWVEAVAWQNVALPTEWTESRYASESGKTFYAKRDAQDNNYVKVEGVEEEICEQILSMQQDHVLEIYTEDNELFELCREINTIVLLFDGESKCHKTSDCVAIANENSYCNGVGKCQDCGPYGQLNVAENACDCDLNSSVACSDDEGNSWCCGGQDDQNRDLICGKTAHTCVPSDDTCQYNIAIPDDLIATDQIATEVVGCPAGTYCYLSWTARSCSTTARPTETGPFYGRCVSRTSSQPGCPF